MCKITPIIIDETIWNTIYSAMKNNSIIEFDYSGRYNTETTHRRVRPYQILLDDGLCFLFGFCELRNAERLFCLSRIKNLIITDDNFTLPQDYEFSSSQDDIIMEWVLAQGATALPLEPKIFADDWKNQIKWMAERAGIL